MHAFVHGRGALSGLLIHAATQKSQVTYDYVPSATRKDTSACPNTSSTSFCNHRRLRAESVLLAFVLDSAYEYIIGTLGRV